MWLNSTHETYLRCGQNKSLYNFLFSYNEIQLKWGDGDKKLEEKGDCMEVEREKSRQKLGGEASWSNDTHPNSGLAVQAGGSLCGYGGMSDMNKAGLVPDEHCY